MKNQFMSQAKQALQNLTNNQGQQNKSERQKEIELVQHSIQAAYENATPEEIQQIKELENKLQQHL